MPNDYRFVAGGSEKSGPYSHFNVMIGTPIGHRPSASYTLALAATVHSLARFGIAYQLHLLQGNCHVDDVRNEIIRDFLESGCTELFFIDDDVGWRPQSFLRLLEVPGDIVAGVYCHRSDGETYPFHPGEGLREANADGLYPMPKVPTGFMRIRRPVLEALYKEECDKGRRFWRKNEPPQSGRKPFAKIVERGFASELGLEGTQGSDCEYHSGDYVLCLKARRAGFSTFADIELPFEHVGEKVYTGHLGNHLRRQQRVDHPLFAQAAKMMAEGVPQLATFDQLNANSMYGPCSALPGKLLQRCWWMAKEAQGPILECGSGLSTLVMGLALKGTGHAVYALESNLEWLRRTGTWLERYGVENAVLIYAPLMPLENDEENAWYGVEPDQLPDNFDAVLLDGPKRSDGDREGVFKIMSDRLARARTWLIDDVSDPDDAALVTKHAVGRDVEFVWGVAGDAADRATHKMAIARLRQPGIRNGAAAAA